MNTVGYTLNNLKILFQTKRFLHSSVTEDKDIIKALYKNRIAPVKLFDSELIDTYYNITEENVLFFNKYKDKGGIYLIQYKKV